MNNFIHSLISKDIERLRANNEELTIVTRFPPEPNGYLHIGHAKSICLNYDLAKEFGGKFNLRFDDTNPIKEDSKYSKAIKEDILWLLDLDDIDVLYASDYFDQLYVWARTLIEEGKAYVDELSQKEIREYRGTVKKDGINSPWRDRPYTESLALLEAMRNGDKEDGSMVLRAKIDMSHPNMKMRDPLIYRVRNVSHDRTGDAWSIYPMYDFAHCLSDAIEGITHSLCTLEFENNRPVYDWFIKNVATTGTPYQTEFARLNLTYTVLSKRKLSELVSEEKVDGWDDPRMPTIAGLRKRGVPASSIRKFVSEAGISKANSMIDVLHFENAIRKDLNQTAPRVMAIMDPLEVVIDNWEDGFVDYLDASLWPNDIDKEGTRTVPFSGTIYIERADFMEEPTKKFYRLSVGREVRLRYGYLITCTSIEKDKEGNIIRIHATHDPDSRGGTASDNRKVKSTLHWVSAEHSVTKRVIEYDRLFAKAKPRNLNDLNSNSKKEVMARCEPYIGTLNSGTAQFERVGYYHLNSGGMFIRVVSLKNTWR